MYRDIFLKSSNPTNVQNSNRSNFHWIHPREWGMGTPLLCGRRPHLPFSPLRQPPSNAATASRAPTHHNQLLPSQNGKTPRNAKPSRHETLGRAAAAAAMATGDDKPPSLDADIDMADLATLDAPASSDAAAAARFRPRAKGKPKPKPKPEPKAEDSKLKADDSIPMSKPEEPKPESAAPMEDSMEVDGVGPSASASAEGVGAEEVEDEEDYVLREIDVYFTPKPFDEDTMVMAARRLPSVIVL